MASTPRRRASSRSWSVSALRPQAARPIALWCVTWVGRRPSSPMAIVSRTLATTPAASSLMCETWIPPISPATRASAITSSVRANVPGT